MKKYKIIISCIVVIVIFSGVLFVRNTKSEQIEQEITLYFLNADEDGLTYVKYAVEEEDKVHMVDEIVSYMKGQLENHDYKPILGENLHLEQIILNDTTATLRFDKSYLEMVSAKEILVRAGLVKNLTQIPGVDHIIIQVGENPLTDVDGSIVGAMTGKMFVDNAKSDFNEHEKIEMTLYFANEELTMLSAIRKEVVYNRNVAIERLVVEKLIEGPEEQDQRATLNESIKIINVSTKDGVCYVNLDATFLTPIIGVNAELTVYSIVNSLVELSNINKVQITINGDINYMYQEQIPLSTVFERKLELVES
ncbi:MAG: GerMN domain-containing protein [Eubacteriales bacterium]